MGDWPADGFEMRPAANLGVLGLRPMDGVACGQKSEKIYFENLREYFRIVSAVSALFSQYNRFLDCEKTRKRRNWTKMDKIWLAAREGVGLAARVLVCSLRELWFYVTQKSRKSQKFARCASKGSFRYFIQR